MTDRITGTQSGDGVESASTSHGPDLGGERTAAHTGTRPSTDTDVSANPTAGAGTGTGTGTDRHPATARTDRRRVLAWGLWDWGSAAFNTVAVTFVFSVYLTDTPAFGGSRLVSSALGWALGAAGIVVLVLAPALGRRTDTGASRRRWLAVTTAIIIACLVGMFFVEPGPGHLVAGLALIAVGTVVYEIAAVNYNAILLRVSTPRTVGTVSAFGWGMGFLGGIALMLVLFVAFIGPEVGLFGVTSADGLNVRVAMLVSALWFAVFAIPVLLAVPDAPKGEREHVGLIESYRALIRDVVGLWRDASSEQEDGEPATARSGHRGRDILRFMIASAIFRDGLTGVFTFAGVLAARAFGFTAGQVIVFGIAANVIAGVVTIATGRLDDVLGPKRMIVLSLVGLLIFGGLFIGLHGFGPIIFWVFGLLFSVFLGPAQTSSRSYLSRMIPDGREGELFGLYATTGRAATFLAPVLFGLFVSATGAEIWGAIGILIPVAAGLVLLLPLPAPGRGGVGDAGDGLGSSSSGSDGSSGSGSSTSTSTSTSTAPGRRTGTGTDTGTDTDTDTTNGRAHARRAVDPSR